MSGPWQIEIEPEVRRWLELLSDTQYDKVERAADLLTVFRKTRQREAAEVERAQWAQKVKVCEADHGLAEHRYDRIKEESP
ncbi:hypothetical protein ABH930_001994 [Kitasatospora sp. GAS204A]|uniref:hypothetical protein n=1 Tax=unclassified Kitasatospora TaxID=2633591 RepID=UPI0024733F21|nr:hypothetical protein [Kitasatospora sp. GAS204B]MDH6116143.1 hypothetical protein [Kitasatospora sp. GAS204B]